MIAWLSLNLPWLCVLWLLGGALVVCCFVRVPRPKVLKSYHRPRFPKPPRSFESEGEYYRRLYDEQIGRSMDLGMRIYELETENKRLAFRLRCAESLISVRALRGDLELDAAASEEGMGG